MADRQTYRPSGWLTREPNREMERQGGSETDIECPSYVCYGSNKLEDGLAGGSIEMLDKIAYTVKRLDIFLLESEPIER